MVVPAKLKLTSAGSFPFCAGVYSKAMNANLTFDALRSKPIAVDDLDVRSPDKYDSEERSSRCKLACAYRLVDLFGWSLGIYNHITLRLPEKAPNEKETFLINPFGLLFHEVTASSLLAVDIDGRVVDRGTSGFGINNRGYTLHSAVHSARPDVACVLHIHGAETIALSCAPDGFVAVSQEGCLLGRVSELPFGGTLVDLDERAALANALGDTNVMLLRNHGIVTCGATVEAAVQRAWWFVINARAHAYLLARGPERLVLPTAKAARVSFDALKDGERSGVADDPADFAADQQWGVGELDWEAWMRCLDRMGAKTSHKYRNRTVWE